MKIDRHNGGSRPWSRFLGLAPLLILGIHGLGACTWGGTTECNTDRLQVDGDCQRVVDCDAMGNTVSAIDEQDTPQSTVCSVGVCVGGTPKLKPRPAGFPVTQEPLGDCRRIECNGLGAAVSVPDDSDAMASTGACILAGCQNGSPVPRPQGTVIGDAEPGNCMSTQCDGQGGTFLDVDDSDLPEDDGITCTTSTCTAGAPAQVSSAPGTPCGGNGFVCHADNRCDSCPDPGPGCPDNGPGEPNNDTQAGALDFGTINDPDANAKSLCGVLGGANDVDWYTYQGHDTLSGLVNPYQSISNGSKARVCAYFKCNSLNTYFTCPSNTQQSTAPNGQQGCCGDEPFQVDDLHCDVMFNDHAQVWIRVDNPNQAACIPYYMRFHY